MIAESDIELRNGIRLHLHTAGKRGWPLMLFLHGFPEFGGAWDAQLAYFGTSFHAVAPDLRGFGWSSQPSDPAAYRTRALLEDLTLLIGQLGYASCVVIAHDWGGALAWALANAQPALVERLVVINSPHPVPFARALAHDSAQRRASEYMNWLRHPGAEVALAANGFALLERFFHHGFECGDDGAPMGMRGAAPAWFDAATRARYHAAWAQPADNGVPLVGAVNYYRASPLHPGATGAGGAPFALDPTEFQIHVPTRVIWGERDAALLPALLDGLDALVRPLDIVRVPRGSHWVIHEQPERINALVEGFVPE
jgi:pimeloyl-ACP methyl ester carboxylesterase